MHLLSLLLLSPVAALPVGVHFGVDQVRPMRSDLSEAIISFSGTTRRARRRRVSSDGKLQQLPKRRG